jgi:hypothetical protein
MSEEELWWCVRGSKIELNALKSLIWTHDPSDIIVCVLNVVKHSDRRSVTMLSKLVLMTNIWLYQSRRGVQAWLSHILLLLGVEKI